MKKDHKFRRAAIELALSKLSSSIQSDVLADGTIASRCGITLTHPVNLTGGVTVDRDNLFAIFRAANDGRRKPILKSSTGKAVRAKVTISQDAAILELENRNHRFAHAALLTRNIDRRMSVLATIVERQSFSELHIRYLQTKVQKPDFSTEDFMDVNSCLASSPEAFNDELMAKLRERRLQYWDLLPDDERHWDNLVGALENAQSLKDFIEGELANEWRGRLDRTKARAFSSLSLSFLSPSLVPLATFHKMGPTDALEAVKALANFNDHFSLIGALELCASRIQREEKFIEIAERVFDKLFDNFETLRGSCGLFASAFIIATSHLAEHETLRTKPVYWRRLAAGAHAALIERICTHLSKEHESLLSWAIEEAGKKYLLTVLREMNLEPRWRPEWVLPTFLIADACGRAMSALNVELERPAYRGLKDRLEKLAKQSMEQNVALYAGYPAILEGSLPVRISPAADLNHISRGYQEYLSEPSVKGLIGLTPLVETFGIPAEIQPFLLKTLDQLRRDLPEVKEDHLDAALTIASHIAVQLKSSEIAKEISELCLLKARSRVDSLPLFELVARLVECAAAYSDKEEAMRLLAERLETLAQYLPTAERALELQSALRALRSVAPEMAALLGRAAAITNLAVSRH